MYFCICTRIEMVANKSVSLYTSVWKHLPRKCFGDWICLKIRFVATISPQHATNISNRTSKAISISSVALPARQVPASCNSSGDMSADKLTLTLRQINPFSRISLKIRRETLQFLFHLILWFNLILYFSLTSWD